MFLKDKSQPQSLGKENAVFHRCLKVIFIYFQIYDEMTKSGYSNL